MWTVERGEETWWWNKQVAEVIKRKKEGYKKWRKDRSEENLEVYKVLKKEARREVASAMESRRIEMVNELEKGGSKMAFRIAKKRAKENRDIIGMPCIQDENRNLKTEISERLEVWRRYCERLVNIENDWDGEVNYAPFEGPWEEVSEKEVR